MHAFAFESLDSKEKSLKNDLVAFLESLGYKVAVGTLDVLSSHKKGDTLTHIKLWRQLQLLIEKKLVRRGSCFTIDFMILKILLLIIFLFYFVDNMHVLNNIFKRKKVNLIKDDALYPSMTLTITSVETKTILIETETSSMGNTQTDILYVKIWKI